MNNILESLILNKKDFDIYKYYRIENYEECLCGSYSNIKCDIYNKNNSKIETICNKCSINFIESKLLGKILNGLKKLENNPYHKLDKNIIYYLYYKEVIEEDQMKTYIRSNNYINNDNRINMNMTFRCIFDFDYKKIMNRYD